MHPHLVFHPEGIDVPIAALPVSECFSPNLLLANRARDMRLEFDLVEIPEDNLPPDAFIQRAEVIMHFIHMAATN